MRKTWYRYRLDLIFLILTGVVLIALGRLHTSIIGQTINGITMPGNPYYHNRIGYNYGNRSASTQRSAYFGGGVPRNTFGFQGHCAKPFAGALQSNRPLVSSLDVARYEVLRGMGGWSY